jgi:hypothetical protein
LRGNKPVGVASVNEEHYGIDSREVVLPDSSRLVMATEVKGGESHVANGQLLRRGMQGGDVLRQPVILEHMQQGGFAGVVQPQEEKFTRLLPQAQISQYTGEPVPYKHSCIYSVCGGTRGNWMAPNLKIKNLLLDTYIYLFLFFSFF